MGNFIRLPRVIQQTAPSMSMTPGRTPHSKSHREEAVAAAIVNVLGEIGDQKAVELVIIMLRVHEKARVRSEAALALGKIGGPKARAALKDRLNQEKDASVKTAIFKAMTPVIHWTFRAAQSEPPRPPSTPP